MTLNIPKLDAGAWAVARQRAAELEQLPKPAPARAVGETLVDSIEPLPPPTDGTPLHLLELDDDDRWCEVSGEVAVSIVGADQALREYFERRSSSMAGTIARLQEERDELRKINRELRRRPGLLVVAITAARGLLDIARGRR